MFTIFGKKKSKETTNRDKIKGYIVPKHMGKNFTPKRFEPKTFEPEKHSFMVKYRDTTTGEIFEIDLYDDEAFDKMMSSKKAQIIFD